MTDTFEVEGSQEIEQDFGIQSQIIQIEGKTAVIKKSVEEVSVNVTDLKKHTDAQFKITADHITQEVKRAQKTEEKLSASIDLNAEQIALKVAKGEVSSQLSVESDGVVIKGNRFSWESNYSNLTADGKLFVKDGTFSGDVTAKSFHTADGKIKLENGKLVITGAEINGTANTSSIGCNVLSANYAHLAKLEVNDLCDLRDVNAGDVYCDDIHCTQIYSKTAGEWWSDRRLKHDIEPIEPDKALEIVNRLNPCTFIINGTEIKNMGFIAQEVAGLEPDLPLYGKKDEYFTIPYMNYIALLAGAIKAQQKEIEDLKNKLEKKEGER